MAKINIDELLKQMLAAAAKPFKKQWPGAKDYAESEFKKIAESIVFIESQLALGKMTPEQARLHLDVQKNASRTVLLTIEGLGILTVEAAINAALGVIRDTVNTALGFVLL
ncbi:MAG: hypothetical protein HY742_09355 [Deltaproteobacteria bacterium]|nr:hypothetical protein [Deltaproteobacteria bacterium]